MIAEKLQKMPTSLSAIKQALTNHGWVLLRNESYTLESFSTLMHELCVELTFDPARQFGSKETQKVDAGTTAVGLHIENGNTALPPDIVAFYSALSAKKGSQTTVCDGVEVYQQLPEELKELFFQPMTVSRQLSKSIWQRYVATAFSIENPDDLQGFIEKIPGQKAVDIDDEGRIEYTLTINPIRDDNLASLPAFANAILGPSYNYQPPIYRFANQQIVTENIKETLTALCEKYTQEVMWKDGDVVVIDNKRMMHGRREILVPLESRKLYIGMGLGLKI